MATTKDNKNMAPSALLREKDDSSKNDSQRKRDENNRPVKRRQIRFCINSSRRRAQQALRRLNQLRVEREMLEKKEELIVKELRFLKNLLMENAPEISQLDLPKSVLNALLSDTTSDIILENDLTKPQSS